MDIAATIAEIETLGVEDRLRIVEAIWDSIAAESEHLSLSEAQRLELERRIIEHEMNPEDGVAWEEARAQALRRIGG